MKKKQHKSQQYQTFINYQPVGIDYLKNLTYLTYYVYKKNKIKLNLKKINSSLCTFRIEKIKYLFQNYMKTVVLHINTTLIVTDLSIWKAFLTYVWCLAWRDGKK